MFTGIVEEVGRILSVDTGVRARTISIAAPTTTADLEVGASVAIDGACLTAVAVEGGRFNVEAVDTTLSRTIAGRYAAGSLVNLERALRVGDRLDGHLVQGHVDGVGELVARNDDGEARLLDLRVPGSVGESTIARGSVTINGVSLTVAELVAPDVVRVAIIPFTWEHTNLGRLEPGDPVNVEGDLIGKYVGKLLSVHAIDPSRG